MGLARDVAESIAEALSPLPAWLVIVVMAMMPIAESRGAILVGIVVFKMHWALTFVLAVGANLLVVPAIWWVLPKAERQLRRSPVLARGLNRIYERTRRRTRRRVETYQETALFFIVALPLPGTGGWTGALVAYLFDLPYRKSLSVIAAGVFTAALYVLLAVEAGINIFQW